MYSTIRTSEKWKACEGRFMVHVEDNTRLTGSLLDSTASEDKNSLTTGTLTMEDMGNKAEYDVKDIGVSYTHYGTDAEKYKHYNESGLVPDLMPGAEDEASSTTHSAIAPGTIITTREQTDLSQINRNTADALHKLDQIFDKKDIQERQELAQLFSKNANELLHQYDRDGTFDKALAHGIVAEISSQIAGNGAGSGFAAGFTNELVINKINEWSNGDPAKAQWISAALGATINESMGASAYSGSFSAQDEAKWNYYGKRRDEKGKILGVGKIAAVLQSDGTYQYVVNVNGKDTLITKEDLYPYTSVWIEDPNNPGYGQTWVINGPDGDKYYSGTFSEERFDNENGSMIYFNLSDMDEMGNIIPGLQNINKKGDDYLAIDTDTIPVIVHYDWGKSLGTNLISTKANMIPEYLVDRQKWGGTGFKVVTKAGGILSIGMTLSEMKDDWSTYSRLRLLQAWGVDLLPLGAGVAIGAVGGGIPGAIGGGVLGDFVKDKIKDTIPTDKELESQKFSTKGEMNE